jgi:hypothetical protein
MLDEITAEERYRINRKGCEILEHVLGHLHNRLAPIRKEIADRIGYGNNSKMNDSALYFKLDELSESYDTLIGAINEILPIYRKTFWELSDPKNFRKH